MSKLFNHAERELHLAGLFAPGSDYDGAIGPAVLKMVAAFNSEEHSGGSAASTLAAFDKVVRWKALSPLTCDPGEWEKVGEGLWQNRRQPSTFSKDGGKTWRDNDEKTCIVLTATLAVAALAPADRVSDHNLAREVPIEVEILEDGFIEAEAAWLTRRNGDEVWLPMGAGAPAVRFLLAHHLHKRSTAKASTGGGNGESWARYDYGTVVVGEELTNEVRWFFEIERVEITGPVAPVDL